MKNNIKVGDFVELLETNEDLRIVTNGKIKKGSIVKVLEIDSKNNIYILNNLKGIQSPSGKYSWIIPKTGYKKVESLQKTKEEYLKEGYKIKS